MSAPASSTAPPPVAFDMTSAYKQKEPQGTPFFDDGREIRLLHHIYRHPSLSSLRNNPAAILGAVDSFARTDCYLMNVGERKGAIVTDLIAKHRPKTMLELGGYVGYSTLLFGEAVRRHGGDGARYYCLERNPEFAAVILSLVDLAGLSGTVKVVVGPSDAGIRRLEAEGKLKDGVDMVFLDHYKPAYTTDLKLCEELGLIRKGTVLAADNVIDPGNPPYLEYVRATVQEKREALEKMQRQVGSNGDGKNGWDERMAERARNQYRDKEGDVAMDANVKGRPDLVYKSRLVESFEPVGSPDGVEVTECVGVESSS